jgi:hypothetical protein
VGFARYCWAHGTKFGYGVALCGACTVHLDGSLITRVGKLELRVPQDRAGRFSTELSERYRSSERALVAALAEMHVQGVSTRKSLPSRRPIKGEGFRMVGTPRAWTFTFLRGLRNSICET